MKSTAGYIFANCWIGLLLTRVLFLLVYVFLRLGIVPLQILKRPIAPSELASLVGYASRFRFLALCAFCWLNHDLAAQDEAFIVKTFSMKDGLPAQGVSYVMQDSRGFIWVATYSGFSRFDGYTFTNYKNNSESPNSLRNNFVESIYEDKQGKLWIAHAEGVDVFDPESENFLLHWPFSDTLAVSGLSFYERLDGKLWICTSHGVYIANTDAITIEKFSKNSIWTWGIAEMSDGSVVIAQNGAGFCYDNRETRPLYRRAQHEMNGQEASLKYFTWCVYVDSSDRAWVGTNSGFELFNPTDKSFKTFAPHLRVQSIFQDIDGTIIIGSHLGAFRFNPQTEIFDTITTIATRQLTKDRQGNIWAASLNGLHQLSRRYKQFSNPDRGRPYQISSITEDSNQNIWIGGTALDRSIISKVNLPTERVSAYEYTKGGPLGLRSLFLDREQSIWAASIGKLEKFDAYHQNVSSTLIPTYIDPITSYVDSNGTMWFGDWNDLFAYVPSTGATQHISSFPSSTVYTFLEDEDKNLWIGSSAGLTRYRLATGKLEVYKNDPKNTQSLSNNVVYFLLRASDSTIWVGTGGGLNRIIKGTENAIPKFQNWRTSNSDLPNDDVYTIIDGKDGTLWLACGNMVSHFSPHQNTFRNYDHNDGLSVKHFRGAYHLGGKGIRASNGKIYLASTEGTVEFFPDSLGDNNFTPPIYITGFSVHNQPLRTGTPHSNTSTRKTLLSKHISYTDKIKLDFNQNDFSIDFAALNYVNAEKNQYKYKLEPYENEWIETHSSNRSARYTNIDPGEYTFRAIGSNNDGVWNNEGASLLIIIAPPWWQTWWAYLLYALTFVVTLLSWRQYDLKRVKLKHRAEHLSELDQLKSRFFANISHEFRTPITLILGPLKKLYEKTSAKEDREELGTMMRNSQRLHRLINQLLDLSKLEAGKIRLHAAPVEVIAFLKDIAASYESLATDKGLRYTFYPEVHALHVWVDVEKLDKIVHNLLANAFKFTGPGGEVILNVRTDNTHCLIVVRDTGIGIPAEQLDKVFDRFYQVDNSQTRAYEGSGLGMALARELVELHKGKISVRSTEGKGTTFTVSLPLGKDHLSKEEISDTPYPPERERLSDIVVSGENGEEQPATTPAEDQPMVLIVEDNADMRSYIRKILTHQYRILEAENGKTGVTLAQEHIPDLIISDIMMPEMDGFQLCRLVKTNEVTSHIPVILLTAKADRESKLSGLETGADDYLSKPFDADELRLIVRNRIGERRKMRERFSREITLEPRQITVTSLDEKFLKKVLAIIEAHIDDEHFSIDELSREAGFSNMHFYRKIRALTDQTPSQFLRTIRLKRAAEMLAKNADTVTQVAYAVGFSSLSYFNKCFKEQFGVTPGQFTRRDLTKP